MCKIQLTRDSGFADRARNYKVVVDGAVIGEIGNGQTETYTIEPGRHILQLRVDWCSSNEFIFELASKETMEFDCGSSLRGLNVFKAVWTVLIKSDSYIWLSAGDS